MPRKKLNKLLIKIESLINELNALDLKDSKKAAHKIGMAKVHIDRCLEYIDQAFEQLEIEHLDDDDNENKIDG